MGFERKTMSENRSTFLEGMSRAAASVSVVATDGVGGRGGVTVSSMTSVSADPPTMLVCINREARSAGRIQENGNFCINLLRDTQTDISDVFASVIDPPGGDKFAVGEWRTGESGAPKLTDALVTFDCRLTDSHQSGSHFIFVGEVVETTVDQGKPLIYGSRSYGIPKYHSE
jgi:flavin reductase